MELAKELNVRIKGVAFHTGSGGVTSISYENSLRNTRKVFDLAASLGMPEMDLIDIGGGFTLTLPDSGKNFDEVAEHIGKTIDELFPDPKVRVIAEPGRYISEDVNHLVCQFIGKKITSNGNKHLYINNGTYQGYQIKNYGEECPIEPLDDKLLKRAKANTFVWGQTCDCTDWIIKNKQLPDYEIGDWVISRAWGAYNKDLSCTFNGFELPDHYYFDFSE